MAQHMMNSHAYFPQDIQIPTYIPNKTPIPVLLLSFGSILAICVLANLFLARHARKLSTYDQLNFCWFTLCQSSHIDSILPALTKTGAFLHLFFEGYFVVYHASIPASQSIFAQLWKEYALSDSRYVVSDPFMLCIESLTVVSSPNLPDLC
jgi:cholestenol delta-isomerase